MRTGDSDRCDADPTSPAARSMSTLLTLRDAAKYLGVCERTIRATIAARLLRCVRIGRAVRIDPADLRAFIERSKGGRR